MQLNQENNLISTVESLENLLKVVKTSHCQYEKYLLDENRLNMKDDKIQKEISICKQEYNQIVSKNINAIKNNSNIYSIKKWENTQDIADAIKTQMLTIESNAEGLLKDSNDNNLFEQFENTAFYPTCCDYSIYPVDLKHTELSIGSKIDFNNKHIWIGFMDMHCYAMILPDNKNVQGYSSGKHCWRMYYQNPFGTHDWLLFGIYKYGIVPKDKYTFNHKTNWGITDNHKGQIIVDGTSEYDKSMQFLYSSKELK